MGTISALGQAHPISAGNTVASEMNDRSATTRSTGPPIAAGDRSRALVRSTTITRGSLRSDQASWPYPTSAATTSAAPRPSRTSVNPRLDAPLAGVDQLRGLLAGSGQAPADELGVDAGAPCHGRTQPFSADSSARIS